MKMRYFILVLIMMLSGAISCSKKIVQGGQDSGGGNTTKSTYGQVEAIFQDEKRLKAEVVALIENLVASHNKFEDSSELIFKLRSRIEDVNLFLEEQQKIKKKSSAELKEDARLLSLKMEQEKEREDEIKGHNSNLKRLFELGKLDVNTEERLPYDVLLDYFPQNGGYLYRKFTAEAFVNLIKIKISYAECFDKHGVNKSASVSDFSIQSTICFNIKKLSELPSDSLFKEISILYVHELMHTLNFLEDDALRIQSILNLNYDSLSEIGSSLRLIRKNIINNMKDAIEKLKYLDFKNEISRDIKDSEYYCSAMASVLTSVTNVKNNIKFLSEADSNLNGKNSSVQFKRLNIIIDEIFSFNHFFGCVFNAINFERHFFLPEKYLSEDQMVFFSNRMTVIKNRLEEIYSDLSAEWLINKQD